jgi:hypothetical protein
MRSKTTIKKKSAVSVTPRNGMKQMAAVMEIVGDPDDLIKPVFPLEDYDMLK